ncbi:hypothetical protein mRhiFer1_009793 [Rhinolophus ferrumequinum]|uniref:Uncharacterized protein n=1 Tax=Rhinolophus ferrumequinum TaxID=59479 RepID=A0A7J7ZDL8_RHIFE|nr:hypothetical protein mRhiFer1_009793 [Rhinolophus ferrumequinum]
MRICKAGARVEELLCPRRRWGNNHVFTLQELLLGSTGALEPGAAERGAVLRPGLVPTTHPQPRAGFSTQLALRPSLPPPPAFARQPPGNPTASPGSGTWEEDKALWRELNRPPRAWGQRTWACTRPP